MSNVFTTKCLPNTVKMSKYGTEHEEETGPQLNRDNLRSWKKFFLDSKCYL